MSRPPTNRPPTKDMYWFAHGGIESNNDKCLNQKSIIPGECEEDNSDSSSPIVRSLQDRRNLHDDQKSPFSLSSAVDSGNSSGPSSLEMSERSRNVEKRIAVEERRKLLLEAEQERNDAVLRKHMEREAALEARRNAQRSNIAFAFGSSIPRNVESLQGGDSEKITKQSNASGLLPKEENHDTLHLRRSVSPFYPIGHGVEVDGTSPQPNSSHTNLYSERKTFSPPCWLVGSGALIGGGGGDDVMSRSMTAAVPAPRGRRKNDLMPTVPYDRTPAPKSATSSTTRKRSVSMTRLDQLAQPRRHYVEANKANSSSGASSTVKDTIKSPTRPLSSASEQSGGSGRIGSSATRRVRSSPRKPRPVSIAGTVPDSKHQIEKISPIKKIFTANKKPVTEAKKASPAAAKPSSAKSHEKSKPTEKAKPGPRAASTPKSVKQSTTKHSTPPKTASPKASTAKKGVTNKKKADMVSSQQLADVASNSSVDSTKPSGSPPSTPPPTDNAEAERINAKHIMSEEEAKAALAEKRRLAKEQAEKEAELERQRQEELRQQEEERLRLEEEEQKRMEEEQLHLIEEHRRLEEEKLRKAIEENERKEEEERVKREEEQRLKAEQEKKAQEEAEKQRIELEEKLRKEEEERAERKKRLEKIMSRTRGKSSGTSPSGSVSGSEQLDSSENQQENLSSGANSLDSNAGEMASGQASVEGQAEKIEAVSDGTSLEANPTYEVASDNESLNDMVMPKSETASQDNSLVIIPDSTLKVSVSDPTNDALCENAMPTAQGENKEQDAGFSVSEEVKEITEAEEIQIQLKENVEKNLTETSDGNNQVIEAPAETECIEERYDLQVYDEKNSTEVDGIIEPVSFQAAPLLETTPFVSSHEYENTVVNEAQVILSFEGDVQKSMSENSVDMNALLPDVSPPSEMYTSEQGGAEEAEIEQSSHFSISSDIKLPDPIYETSDDGSVSSERHQQEGSNYVLQYEESHQESHPISDEVFNEQEAPYSEETNFNPFEKSAGNSSSNLMAAYESQFEIAGMQDSVYAYETSEVQLSNVTEQSRELEEGSDYEKRLSSSNIPDANEDIGNVTSAIGTFPGLDENKENVDHASSYSQMNPFAVNNFGSEYDVVADKENLLLNLGNEIHNMSMYQNDMLTGQLTLESNQPENSSSDSFQGSVLEQNFENQSLNKSPTIPSESLDFSNVTVIKAEGSDDCIGIISSIEHDHISNNLVQNIQNEQLKSNFDYSCVTDSEESSLDSNLSQVMTVEVSETSSVDVNNIQKLSSTAEYSFIEPALNGSSVSKSNGDHYSEREVLNNGHRIESSDPSMDQIADYVQLDGKHISSVDHSKNNIFDNVDAVEFGKMSSDPFLLKGNSNQMSGNPFLLQEEQKQVLMTPDFFN